MTRGADDQWERLKRPAGDRETKAAEELFALVQGKRTVNSVAYDSSHPLTIEAEEPMRLADHIVLGLTPAWLQGLHEGAPEAQP